MKFLSICAMSVALMLATLSCTNNHLISDEAERAAVQADFDKRAESWNQGDLFKVFEQEMSDQQREALTFLYAYMPLGDITDYSGEFFLENIDYSLKAKEEMPWGKLIPEREFRHFVLPIRVNNENLDNSRKVFYEELKDRVKNLSLHDAVLEVNHWCHEKVVYTPSDSRTSSPLASVKTAYGRCGEESTFTVAALRAVGIPARQVYTPRWAHTDDNHAWVEAWVDGKWYFLGACEPEPVLNLGWFNAPASRGMLMHTKVFGRYNGPEEIMHQNPNFTEINIIGNYAPFASAYVKIVDAAGQPVEGAKVEFKVYNYAEFYTVATKKSDTEGKTFLSAGKGDMLVWASKDGQFGYGKVAFGVDNEVEIKLDKKAGETYSVELDIVPPAEGFNMPEVTPEQRAENNRRFAIEDSIRNAYVATFMTDASAREFAKKYQLDEDAVAKILVASRGNYDVITNFLARLRSDKSKAG
ncbi:MAG: transglutaminase domain-containing protein, partial [Bacteroidaceae bacterium]|nr:transglutaminase domain-containing protein [Bacteroidaceae bacterium]